MSLSIPPGQEEKSNANVLGLSWEEEKLKLPIVSKIHTMLMP